MVSGIGLTYNGTIICFLVYSLVEFKCDLYSVDTNGDTTS